MSPQQQEPRAPQAWALRLLSIAAGIALGWGAFLILWFAIRPLLLTVAGLLFAVLLYTLSAWLSKRTHARYGICFAITCLGTLAVTATVVWFPGLRITNQWVALKTQSLSAFEALRSSLKQNALGHWLTERVAMEWKSVTSPGQLSSGLVSFTGMLAEVAVVFFVGIFVGVNPALYRRGILKMLPPRNADRAELFLGVVRTVFWKWLLGQFIAIAFIGVVTALVAWALGVPLAITLWLIAAALNFVPNFGPLIAAVPAVLLASTQGLPTVAYIALAYVAIELLQNNLVTPIVQQKTVSLPPAVLIIAQVLMYHWGRPTRNGIGAAHRRGDHSNDRFVEP